VLIISLATTAIKTKYLVTV